jgi:flagellar hook-associated protein 1 FlgK
VPGSNTTLETVYNNFTASLQALSTSPDSTSARSAVLDAAQVVTQQLNGLTTDIQGLRSDAELGIADAVARANDAMTRLAQINRQLGTATDGSGATASLLDERDNYLDRLAQLMDITVSENGNHQVSVSTNSGVTLVGNDAAQLEFDAQGTMTAAAAWNVDPAKRTVGTIVLRGANGDGVDLIAGKAFRSGEIAAYLDMRDNVLPQAQSQLDEIAAGLSRALSDRTSDATPVPFGAQTGFDIDLSGILDGNSVRISYTDNASATKRTLTLVRVDDPAALPLSKAATADPGDTVIGLNFSGGLSSIVSQLTTALGVTGLAFSNPVGSTLRILDDGAANRVDVDAVSATKTAASLTGGSAELPFFLDGGNLYTGAFSSTGPQTTGLAGRISVNSGLIADPSRLIVYQTAPLTAAGDSTRPNFIYGKLTDAALTFAPQSGIGTAAVPFTGSLQSYMRLVISQQGEAAQSAADLKQGQDVVFNSLQQRFNDSAGVNIDQEMANLLSLQNAYAANARVLSTAKEMLDTLLKVGQ